jgi:adenine phosphoribosyltransferase
MLIEPEALPSPHVLAFLESKLRSIPDFPKPGIIFKDITPLLDDGQALNVTLDLLTQPFFGQDIRHVVAMEARGFIFGASIAARLNAGFVPVRKPGKLPAATDSVKYSLEYGESELHMHQGTIAAGERVLIVDDLLATGGTAKATGDLVRKQGGEVVAYAFVVELDFLKGRDLLGAGSDGPAVYSLIHVGGE